MLSGLANLLLDGIRERYLEPILRSLRREAAGYVEDAALAARRVVLMLGLLIFVITLLGAGLVLVPVARSSRADAIHQSRALTRWSGSGKARGHQASRCGRSSWS